MHAQCVPRLMPGRSDRVYAAGTWAHAHGVHYEYIASAKMTHVLCEAMLFVV